MESNFYKKLTTIVFGLILLVVIGFFSLMFLKPKNIQRERTKVFEYSNHDIWSALADKKYYLASKQGLYKSDLDSSLPTKYWSEYFNPSDSIQGKVVSYNNCKNYHYILIDPKHEFVTGIKITLDSLEPKKTKVRFTEQSNYLNPFANLYLNILYPETAINFEELKLTNTLTYMDSIQQQKTL